MTSKKAVTPRDIVSFTALLEDLEEIVTLLESGDVELEQAIDVYERGRNLATECQKRLKAAEGRLRIIDETGQEAALSPELAAMPGFQDE
jgi:exodeoxyribonuclease VII small subunit